MFLKFNLFFIKFWYKISYKFCYVNHNLPITLLAGQSSFAAGIYCNLKNVRGQYFQFYGPKPVRGPYVTRALLVVVKSNLVTCFEKTEVNKLMINNLVY